MFNIISPDILRAARALLGWSQSDLARHAGLTQATVANLEVGKHLPSKATLTALQEALESSGMEIMPDGVRILREARELSGESAFPRLFQDINQTIRTEDCEILISGANERHNRLGVEEQVRQLRRRGTKMRVLVEESNHYLLAPLSEYRAVPSKYFMHNPTIIYGDRVAISIPDQSHDLIRIFINKTLAESQRRLFNFLWDHSPQPTHSEVQPIY